MNIEDIKEYIETCPYLDANTIVNVDYLSDSVISYSITEETSYNPIISEDIIGNKQCQFIFNFDAKLNWTDETENNINNSNFFRIFSSWIEQQNNYEIYPNVSEDITIESIKTTTNGYILMTNSNEAIYRIGLIINYYKSKNDNIISL